MKLKLFVNPDYEYLRAVIESIPDNFRWMGATVQTGRNEIKYFDTHGVTLVIKSFQKITLANRIIYALFRKPKSIRSFENTVGLIRKGILAPTPVAYISVYSTLKLIKDYYVYLYLDNNHINNLLSKPLPQSESALRSFANFTYGLHAKGIFHNDYNLNNILYSYNGYYYTFSLIDINRICFKQYNPKKGLRNLQRLELPIENLAVICSEYSKQSKIDELKTILEISSYRLQYLTLICFKRRIKSLFASLL